ncbi:hypothetical protein N7G274_001924 [Stereocaulon virgatum]|uniref:Uncharacterized protein n=1 Tax=Stereocaulon virgatum TaxID=373712 RepID=A0ABR4AL15_9LECA
MGRKYTTSRLLPRSHLYNNVQHKGNTHFDDSGQVFTEKTCPAGPMTADWVWKTRGSSRQARFHRSMGPGCSSLFDMAIRSALDNSSDITAESLQGLPWDVAGLLWQRIIAAQVDSVNVWKAFASAYPHEADTALKSKYHAIPDPDMGLFDYIKPMTSPSFSWITFLTLSNIGCSRATLIQVSQLVNLGNLTLGPGIQAPDIGIDDSIIRNWGRLAAESNAFSLLRILHVRQQKEITSRVFTHFNQFPALVLFNVEGCNLGSQEIATAQQHGWKYKTGIEMCNRLVKCSARGPNWNSIVHDCFRLGGDLSAEKLTDESLPAANDLPVFHLSIGDAGRGGLMDATGCQSMRCYYRTTKEHREDSERLAKKRLLTETKAKVPHKKPTVRASKHQNMEDLLTDFGG